MPLRICHIITTWNKQIGSSNRTLNIIRGLKKLKYEICLMVSQDSSNEFLREVKISENINVWRIPYLRKYNNITHDIKSLLVLKNKLQEMQYDLVHTHLAKAGIIGRLAARWAKVPAIVHTVHGPSFPASKIWHQRKFYRFLEKWAAFYTDAMVFVGHELQDYYLRAGVGTPEKSHLIYTGRDFTPFLQAQAQPDNVKQALREQLGYHRGDLIVGYIARVVPSKGHILAIRAAGRLCHRFPNLRFLFIGEANIPSEKYYKVKLMKEVAKNQLQDRIKFVDYQADIHKYYAIFDLFVLPSTYEGLPNVIIEAAVMGLPIVAFDCGGVREILGDQENIVPQGDFEAFLRRLEQTVEYLSKGHQMTPSLEMKESLIKRWSIDSMIQNKDRLYRGLLGRFGHG